MLKNPPAMQKISVRFLGWEDPLEKGMATHFSSTGESICRAAVEMKTQSTELWTQQGKQSVDEWREQHGSMYTTVWKTESQREFAV